VLVGEKAVPVERVSVTIDGDKTEELALAYELLGEAGRTWALTPGGRYSMDYPGVRELGLRLSELGNRVLLYDRPNTGRSEVCFTGVTESGMQADALAALISHLDISPAVMMGGSGGARVSLLTAQRHPEVASGLAVWMMSGGAFGLLTVGTGYCAEPIRVAWNGGMQAVVDIPQSVQGNWYEQMELNPANRRKLLDQDPKQFIATMERWLLAYCPCGDTIPGITDGEIQAISLPALVFHGGESDMFHTRATSERLAELLPNGELVEPPWPDREWVDSKLGQRFVNWPRLAPILDDWARGTLG
jgi:pimeloyl-ACP methyl ester carboxylesterase